MYKKICFGIIASINLLNAGCGEQHCGCSNDKLLKSEYELCNDCGISVSGSLLVWQPHVGGLDYVINNCRGTAFANSNAKVERIDYKWTLGGRASIGYIFPEGMQVDLLWMGFFGKGSDSAKATTFGGLFPVWTIPGAGLTPAINAKASWKLDLNMLDLQLLGVFVPRSYLELRPFIALSGEWINQRVDINTCGGSSTQIANANVIDDNIDMKNKFYGIGPKVGIRTLWDIMCGFGIFGDFDVAIYYGRFDIKQYECVRLTGLNPAIIYLDIDSNRFNLSTVNLDMAVGLRWDRMFCDDCYHVSFQVGWENFVLLKQNKLMRFVTTSSPGINVATNGDLTMQGVTIRAQFDF